MRSFYRSATWPSAWIAEILAADAHRRFHSCKNVAKSIIVYHCPNITNTGVCHDDGVGSRLWPKQLAHRRLLVTVAVGALVFAPAAKALNDEEASPSNAKTSEQQHDRDVIVVTGEKLDRPLQETHSSVVVSTGKSLEDRSIKDLYDLASRTPNVTRAFGEKGFAIRGIDQRLGAGAGLLISTVVDGASLPNDLATYFGPYSTWDVDQIEIFRGPQGTSQGRNAVGGAIIINTAEPKLGILEAKGRVSYAELGSRQIAGAANLPLSRSLAARMSFDSRQSDGWVYNPIRDEDYDSRKSTNLRGKLLFRPSETLSASYGFSYTDSEGGEDLVAYASFPELRINNSNDPGRERSEHQIHSLRLKFSLSDSASLVSIGSYYRHDYSRIEDFDGQPVNAGLIDRSQLDDNYQQEIRLHYEGSGRFRGVVGAFFGKFDSDVADTRKVPTTIVNPQLPLGSVYQNRIITNAEENFAFFGELEASLDDRLSLIFGARYDTESRMTQILSSTRAEAENPLFQDFLDRVVDQLAPEEYLETDTNYNSFLPKLGLRFELLDAVYVGLTAQRAYRAGGTSVSAISQTLSEYRPEHTWTYEFSTRAGAPEDRVSVAANLFYTDWRDQIVNHLIDPDVPQDFIALNAGASRLMGAEAELKVRPSDRFELVAGLGLLDTKFTSYESDNAEFTGNVFAFAPRYTLAGGVEYRHPTGLQVVADIHRTAKHYASTSNDPTLITQVNSLVSCTATPCNDPRTLVPAYTIVNAKVGYSAGLFSIFAFSRNLLDENYITFLQANGRARSGEPRVAGIELTIRM